jgi:hypothetical protein
MLTFDKLIIPLASSMVGLIPVLINLTVNWLDKRSSLARRNVELQYANQRVGFLTSWYNLQKDVSDTEQMKRVREMVSEELREMYEEFANAMLDMEEETRKRQELILRVKGMNLVKRLFLLYTPYNIRGWLYHTLFYMCIMPLLVGLGYAIYTYFQTQTWFTNVPQEYWFIGAGIAVLAIIFHWLGRAAAKDMEQRMIALERKTTPLGRFTPQA